MAWWRLEVPLLIQPDGTVQRRSRLVMSEERAADDTKAAVQEIVQRRSALLRISGWEPALRGVGVGEGRILILLTEHNLSDGAAGLCSHGFFGDYNFPPCDLWIGLISELAGRRNPIGPALASWIPDDFVALAQRGIDVNPEECLVWADEVAPQLHHELMARS